MIPADRIADAMEDFAIAARLARPCRYSGNFVAGERNIRITLLDLPADAPVVRKQIGAALDQLTFAGRCEEDAKNCGHLAAAVAHLVAARVALGETTPSTGAPPTDQPGDHP